MNARAVLLSLAAVAGACGSHGPQRTLHFHGVTIVTDMRASLAVIGNMPDGKGGTRPLGYALLGDSAGEQTVGGDPGAPRINVQFGVDADIWLLQPGKEPTRVAAKDLRGLTGANVDTGSLELRDAKQTFDLPANVGSRHRIDSEQSGVMSSMNIVEER